MSCVLLLLSQLHVAASLRKQEAGVGHLGVYGGVLQRTEKRRLQDHPARGRQTRRLGLIPRRDAAHTAHHGRRQSLLQGECCISSSIFSQSQTQTTMRHAKPYPLRQVLQTVSAMMSPSDLVRPAVALFCWEMVVRGKGAR